MKEEIQLSYHFTTKRLLSFVFPSVTMMLFTSTYGMIDGYFVSNFAGETSFAALNLIWPLIAMLGSVGFMFSAGGSALVAKTLGEGKDKLANSYFSMIVIFAIIAGLALSVVGFIFIEDIARMMGASEEMMPLCLKYGRILMAGNVAFVVQNLFQGFFVTAQKPKYGFYSIFAAGITNIILDALFIAVFDWGITGAAYATIIGYIVGATIPLVYFTSKKNISILKLRFTPIKKAPIIQAGFNGLSEFMGNVSMSIVSILYNYQLMKYIGKNGVAAYGMIMYVGFFFVAIFLGFSIGASPVIAFHYGAGNKKEMRNLLKKGMKINICGGIFILALTQLIALPISKLYMGYNVELMECSCNALRLYSICFLMFGVNIFTSSYFTSLNNGLISATIATSRSLIFEAGSVLILPALIGVNGIWISASVGEFAAMITAVTLLLCFRKRYGY